MATAAPSAQLRSLWQDLNPAQREAFLRDLGPNDTANAKPKRTPIDLKGAVEVTFGALVIDGERVTDKSRIGQTLWFKGHIGAKGPRGGVYCYGRCSVGPHEGVLKISQRAFEQLKAGGSAAAWVRFDGANRDTLIGILSAYRSTPR